MKEHKEVKSRHGKRGAYCYYSHLTRYQGQFLGFSLGILRKEPLELSKKAAQGFAITHAETSCL